MKCGEVVVAQIKEQEPPVAKSTDRFEADEIVGVLVRESDAVELEIEDVDGGVELEGALPVLACGPCVLERFPQRDDGGIGGQHLVEVLGVVLEPVRVGALIGTEHALEQAGEERGDVGCEALVKGGARECFCGDEDVEPVERCEGRGGRADHAQNQCPDEWDKAHPSLALDDAEGCRLTLDEIGGQEGGDKSRQIAMIHGESRFVGFGSCSNSQLPRDGFLFQPLTSLSEHGWGHLTFFNNDAMLEPGSYPKLDEVRLGITARDNDLLPECEVEQLANSLSDFSGDLTLEDNKPNSRCADIE